MWVTVPLYGGGSLQPQVIPFPQNRPAITAVVKSFLCPSDQFRVVIDGQGPSNYVACMASNVSGDAPAGDGIFIGVNLDVSRNTGFRVTDITDGASNTVAFSESLLGAEGRAPAGATDIRLYYKQVTGMSDEADRTSEQSITIKGDPMLRLVSCCVAGLMLAVTAGTAGTLKPDAASPAEIVP
jgi:hypothetical protein